MPTGITPRGPASNLATKSKGANRMTSTYLEFLDKKGQPHRILRASAPVADTHTHLISRELVIADALQAASEAGVELVVTPLDPAEEAKDPDAALAQLTDALAAVSNPPTLRILAGAHPYHAESFLQDGEAAFHKLLAHPLAAGIGEIGLDYTCDVPKELQAEAFSAQLSFAVKQNLPVELHIRDQKDDENVTAHKDAEHILSKVGMPKQGCVLHCFTQGPSVMRPFLDMGCTIAYGGALTFKKSEEIRQAALETPLTAIVTETDAPYMSPEPLRGMPCRCAFVTVVEDFLATLFEEAKIATKREVEEALWQNATKLFLS